MTKKVTFDEENLIQARETIDEYRQEERSKLRYNERPSFKRSDAFSENDPPTIIRQRKFKRSNAFMEIIQNAIDDAERSNNDDDSYWQNRNSNNKQEIVR